MFVLHSIIFYSLLLSWFFFLFFFFKRMTEYELRISDWSSDVCSSDLAAPIAGSAHRRRYPMPWPAPAGDPDIAAGPADLPRSKLPASTRPEARHCDRGWRRVMRESEYRAETARHPDADRSRCATVAARPYARPARPSPAPAPRRDRKSTHLNS